MLHSKDSCRRSTSTGKRIMNERRAAGYDIVVWIDEDGDAVCGAFTRAGEQWLQTIVGTYRKGDIMIIHSPPNVFEASIPEHLRVGYENPDTKRISLFDGISLH